MVRLSDQPGIRPRPTRDRIQGEAVNQIGCDIDQAHQTTCMRLNDPSLLSLVSFSCTVPYHTVCRLRTSRVHLARAYGVLVHLFTCPFCLRTHDHAVSIALLYE